MIKSPVLRKSLLLVLVACAFVAAPSSVAAPPTESPEGLWQSVLTQTSYSYTGPASKYPGDGPFENVKTQTTNILIECDGDACTMNQSIVGGYPPPGGITVEPDNDRGRWMAEYQASEPEPCTPIDTESLQLVRQGDTISGSVTLHQKRTGHPADGPNNCAKSAESGYDLTVNWVIEGTLLGGGGDDPAPAAGSDGDLSGDWHFVTTHVSTNGGSGAAIDAPQSGETDLTISCDAKAVVGTAGVSVGGGRISGLGAGVGQSRIGGLGAGVGQSRIGGPAKMLLPQAGTSCFVDQGLVDGWPPSGNLQRGADGAWTATYTSSDPPSCDGEEPTTYTVTLTRDADRISGSVVWKYFEAVPDFKFNVGKDAVCSDPNRSQATSSFTVVGTLQGSDPGLSGEEAESEPTPSENEVALSFPDANLAGLTARQLASVGAVARGERSVVPAALVTPGEAMSNTTRLVQNSLLAAVLVLLLVFPSQLFNSTWDEHHDRVLAALPWLRRKEKAAVDAPTSEGLLARPFVKFLLVAVASAVLGGFLDPAFGLDSASIALVLGVLGALLLGTVVSGAAARTYRRLRDLPAESTWASVPAGLVIAAVCVIVSRAVHFRPGYLYGLVGGIAFAAALDKRDSGRSEMVGVAGGIALALGAWLLFVPVSNAVNDGGGFALQVADALLASLFIGGIEGALFGLIPVRFLPGHKIAQHSWVAWAAAAGVAAFLFVHVLLRPENGYLGTSSTASVAVTYGLFAAFGIASVAFWGWFRTHPDPPGAPTAPAAA